VKVFSILFVLITSSNVFAFDLLNSTPAFVKNHPIGKSTAEALEFAGGKDKDYWQNVSCAPDIVKGCSEKFGGKQCQCLTMTFGDKYMGDKMLHSVTIASIQNQVVDYSVKYLTWGDSADNLPMINAMFGDTKPKKIMQGKGDKGFTPAAAFWSNGGIEAYAVALCGQRTEAGAPVLTPYRKCGLRQGIISKVRKFSDDGSSSNLAY
jgi:hypothetical protein